ncbi:hypothetical protein SAMN04489761_1599 [Tenacibaculum sp. MAR_2009_124]|uniref:hypothetical protein n=1 Tax=Tenacibaculum sp. MAR_2009_124 TaxID=1250059 RepID=UPI00089C77A6|nr:hypothetical protein [Tenacibaculum sp. MAR_2009_124]SEB73274.1 hypothetical protein SAMN04489761_1599 [Tenacibaculum sp. MAR_2009_124]
MKKIYLTLTTVLVLIFSCSDQQDTFLPEDVSNVTKQIEVTNGRNFSGPTTHEDFGDFEHVDPNNPTPNEWIYETLLVTYIPGTSEARRNEIRNKFFTNTSNNWDLFTWVKCSNNKESELWTIRRHSSIDPGGPKDVIEAEDDIADRPISTNQCI